MPKSSSRPQPSSIHALLDPPVQGPDTRARLAEQAQFFDLAELPWKRLTFVDGQPNGLFPQSVLENVDVAEYRAGIEFQDAGLRLLQCRLLSRFPAGFFCPRRRHSVDQLVFVTEGEACIDNQVFRAPSGWYVPAGHIYATTVGPQGVTYLEVRRDPLEAVETEWIEDDPTKWIHHTYEAEEGSSSGPWSG